MKAIRLNNIGCLLMITVCLSACTPVQQTGTNSPVTSDQIEQAIRSDHWVFVPDQVSPQRGRTRMLNTGYELELKADTLNCYLPYFGRAYGGSGYGSGKGPLDFTSLDFDYSREKNTKDAWEISIKPKDYTEVRQMFFTLYDNGTAQLNVQFVNRDPISFNGTVRNINR